MVSIKEVGRGSTDDVVLALALAENRVLLTFDKDFEESKGSGIEGVIFNSLRRPGGLGNFMP